MKYWLLKSEPEIWSIENQIKSGVKGALGSVVSSVSSESGEPINYMYFWLTGILSSFLDNAPTYLVFFNTAGGGLDGGPELLLGDMYSTL